MNKQLRTRTAIALAGVLAAAQAVAPTYAQAAAPAYAQAGPDKAVAVTCGEVISASLTVANNLTCTGTALTIGASNVVLNLGSHTISGALAIGDPESGNTLTGDTVQNGTVTGTTVAISLSSTKLTTLSRLTLTDNGLSTSKVIDPVIASGLLVEHSTISGGAGAVLSTSSSYMQALTASYDTIQSGLVELVNGVGGSFSDDKFTNASLTLDEEGGDTVANSTFTNSPVADEGSYSGDSFKTNTMSGASVGLLLDGPSGIQVTDNTFSANNIGLMVAGDIPSPGGDSVTGNSFTKNKTAGAYVDEPDNSADGYGNMSFTGNTVSRNGSAPDGTKDAGGNPVVGGIHIYVPGGTITVSNNTSSRNSGFGIWSLGSTASGTGNVSTGDQDKCGPLTLCTYK